MYRFLLKPKWIVFHVVVVAAIVLMVNLAGWQLRRLHERQDFNARVETNTQLAVASLTDVVSAVAAADPAGQPIAAESVEWRRVVATGTYLQGEQVEVVNRSQLGDVGRNIVDVLVLDDGTAVLVNRGFVPSTETTPPTPSGEVEVIGRLRRSEQRRTGQTEDASGVELQQIRRIDIAKLQPQIEPALRPMYIEQLQSQPAEGKWPAPVVAPELGEGPHLSYTFQWLIFSISVAVGWVFAVRRSAATLSGRRVPTRKGSPPPIDDELSKELREKRQS